MLVLDTTTKSVTVAMSGAAATTNPDFVTAYSDDTGTSFAEGSSDGALNGTTQVTLVAAPAASTKRLIKSIFIQNKDTASVTLTITVNNNGTLRNLAKVTLAVGDTWSTDGTTDTNGNLKTTINGVTTFSAGSTGLTPSSASQGVITLAGTLNVANGGTGVTASTGASSVVLRDTNANITANSITPGWTSTATATGTTTLTVASTYYQRFTGSTTQTVVLPSATTVALGQGFIIDNDSSGNLTLQDGSAGALGSIVPGMAAFVFCENNSTTAGSWSGYMFVPGSGPSGQVTWGTAGLAMGGQTISSSVLSNPTVTNYVETLYSANTSTAITVALTNGTVQLLTLTGNATITMPTAVAGKSFIIMLKQDATGSRTVTWTTVVWGGGTVPTITATASKMDIYSFFSDGTNWYGATIGQNY